MIGFSRIPVRVTRGLCIRCLRADSVCYCRHLDPISPSFEVVLLQHPKERKNTIGTARMTHLCLANSRLLSGIGFENDPTANGLIDDPGNFCVVLFPGPDAVNVSENAETFLARVRSKSKNLVVFVIDGTWSQARGMIRKSPRIASLPQICFTPKIPSQYKVRKQPNPLCLSTIEATHSLIEFLNPEIDASLLLALFAKMVDRQIECGALNKLREHSVSPNE
ncbi:MAG: DTW domain-containing protein [Cryobacterium sp.]|nr:DTW domain-containing protein [Oligoflexia bacterium]